MSTFKFKEFGAIIIGEEILSGKRQDKHLNYVIKTLKKRGLKLNWSFFLRDEPKEIEKVLYSCLSQKVNIFCFGGIGATPDDHTRQAAAKALNVELKLHKDAEKKIVSKFKESAYPHRINMGVFPKGAKTIDNPYNNIPGFTIKNIYFFPGFPEMAWPMIDLILDKNFKIQNRTIEIDCSVNVYNVGESFLIPIMKEVKNTFLNVYVYSLPTAKTKDLKIEIGVKGKKPNISKAFSLLKKLLDKNNFTWKSNN
jgi:molybdopterin-biosynthesis enzyme MoeA-like protein